MDLTKFIEALQATRGDYEQEGILHQFLVDSYTGGGGFRNGQVPSLEAPYWGRAASAYGDWMAEYDAGPPPYQHRRGHAAKQTWSHLTAFYGEDAAEYADRVNNSVYLNLIAPIVEIVNAFLTEEDSTRDGLEGELKSWPDRVTPLGAPLRAMVQETCLRGQVVGYVFGIVDTPAEDQGPSRATSKAPYLSLFWPQQVLDWDCDADGRIVALKLCTPVCLPRPDLLQPKQQGHLYTLWYPTHWEKYLVVDERSADEVQQGTEPKYRVDKSEGKNPIGRVPVAVFRWRPLLSQDPVKGQPQIHAAAQIARDLYNAESERRHLDRTNAFNMLVVPGGPPGADPGTVATGPGNVQTEDKETKGLTRYIGPTASPFEEYKDLCEQRKQDIYDACVMDRGLSRQAETAEARRLRFQRTNMMLRLAASSLCEWEKQVLILAGLYLGQSEESLQQITVTRKDDYAIQQFSESLEAALKVNDLPMHPECQAEVVNAVVVDDLLSNLPDERREELRALNFEHAKKSAEKPPAPPAAPPDAPPPDSPPDAQAAA